MQALVFAFQEAIQTPDQGESTLVRYITARDALLTAIAALEAEKTVAQRDVQNMVRQKKILLDDAMVMAEQIATLKIQLHNLSKKLPAPSPHPDTGDTAVLDRLLGDLKDAYEADFKLNRITCTPLNKADLFRRGDVINAEIARCAKAIHDHVAALVQAEREILCPHCGKVMHER